MEQKTLGTRGRPPKKPSELGKRVNVYMPPDVEAWLKSRPGGMSKAIAALVRKEIGAK